MIGISLAFTIVLQLSLARAGCTLARASRKDRQVTEPNIPPLQFAEIRALTLQNTHAPPTQALHPTKKSDSCALINKSEPRPIAAL